MANHNLLLYVAAYDEAGAAESDWADLKKAEKAGDITVEGAVVVARAADGTTRVEEHGATPAKAGVGLGAIGGLVLGLFAPPLLLSTALGAVAGGAIGALVERHQELELGVDLEEYLPPGSSAIVVVAEDTYLDRLEAVVAKAVKRIDKAIDTDDYDKVKAAVDKAVVEVEAAAGA